MVEIIGDPAQASGWTDAVDGRDVDWRELLSGYVAQVDWPGASFWREISAANPEALVLLSTREPDAWYRSASNTIFRPTLHKMFEEMRAARRGRPERGVSRHQQHERNARDPGHAGAVGSDGVCDPSVEGCHRSFSGRRKARHHLRLKRALPARVPLRVAI
jgi:hypothetical protein